MASKNTEVPKWLLAAGGATAVLLALKILQTKSEKSAKGGGKAPAESEDHGLAAGVVKEAQKKAVSTYIKEVAPKLDAKASDQAVKNAGDLSKYLAFKEEYGLEFQARPDVGEGQLLKVTDWYRLTPEDYDRTTFHVEFDVRGTSLEHLVNGADGKALSVYATNDPKAVAVFLKDMKIDPHQIVSITDIAPQEDENAVVLTTMEKLFTQYLDLFGKPTREFLKKLAPFAVDIMEKVAIAELTLERKTEDFQDKQAKAMTFAEYLTEYKSLNIPAEKYLELIPTVKQRVYSICSSTDYRPGKCQLLVVREDWQAKGGDTKFGLCSSFLTFLRAGKNIIGHSTHSVMKIPEDKTAHIFMAGLGTGLAPFRAYVEQRKFQKDQGHKIGKSHLFFGGRYEKQEYYYRDEFEAFEKEGIVKCCNAWSRDTPGKKVYVQNKIGEEADAIWEELGKPGSTGYFFLCGSKQPEKDVFAMLLSIMQTKGGMTASQAQQKMESLQAEGRYVTEVY